MKYLPEHSSPAALPPGPLHRQHHALLPSTRMGGDLWSQPSRSQAPAPTSQGASGVLAPTMQLGAHRVKQRGCRSHSTWVHGTADTRCIHQ